MSNERKKLFFSFLEMASAGKISRYFRILCFILLQPMQTPEPDGGAVHDSLRGSEPPRKEPENG